jgi:hypothetical protein
MLPLGKHSQFAREAAGLSPASLSFTSVGLISRKYIIFPEENNAETVFTPLLGAQKYTPS